MTTLNEILKQFERSYARFQDGFPIDDDPKFYAVLYDYFTESGELPNHVNPHNWLTEKLEEITWDENFTFERN